MITKIIISEREKSFITPLVLISGDDKDAVEHEAKEKFRQIIRENNDSLSQKEIDDCVKEEFYYNNSEGNEFGVYLMEPEQLVEV